MSTYSSDLSDTSGAESLTEIKRKKRKHHHHADGGKMLKYYKYLYEQKCRESDHYKKLYRAKNKECEQLTTLNQQYQGRVIAYLLESHTSNSTTYASSMSRCSSQNDILRDEDFSNQNDVDDLLVHDIASSHSHNNKPNHNCGDDPLNPVKSYDFVEDVSIRWKNPR